MTTSYGWVITRTTFADERPGVFGPRGLTLPVQQIEAQGREFRMLDADGALYYQGFYLGPDDERMFAPLDDYGLPNAGATVIEYRTESGGWEAL